MSKMIYVFCMLMLGGIIAYAVESVGGGRKQMANMAAQKATQQKEIADFRTAWMNDCLQHAPPFQCVAMWSQVKPEEWTR